MTLSTESVPCFFQHCIGSINIKPLPEDNILALSRSKGFAEKEVKTLFKTSFPRGRKHWEKEKKLVTSIFSFKHCLYQGERALKFVK